MKHRGRIGACVLACMLGAASAAACAVTPEDEEELEVSAHAASTAADLVSPVLVRSPSVMKALEARGLSFAKVFGADGESGKSLARSSRYASLVQIVSDDVQRVRSSDRDSGVGLSARHRLFDVTWLRSPNTRFELVAVSNRFDRKHVAGAPCGEVRLVYRLAYTNGDRRSRLPMTVNVVYPQRGPDCRAVATSWIEATKKADATAALLAGPLARLGEPASVELDYQLVRWPSTFRADMGGHIEYALRVLDVSGDRLVPTTLENTPRTSLSAADKAELRAWIGEHLDEIDDGTAVLPKKFLATRTVSVAPRGLARLANRPFAQIFDDAEAAFGRLPLSRTKLVRSPAALLRRLDEMTCNGCHQSRSIAGFHLLGEERDDGARMNALAVGVSAHVLEQLEWRRAMLESAAAGRAFREPRPFADHGTNAGKFGARCGLTSSGSAFSDWTCASGLECEDTNGDEVGECGTKNKAGDACEVRRVTRKADPHEDDVVGVRVERCELTGGKCTVARVGFPGGMCRRACPKLGVVSGDSICGPFPGTLTKFNRCLRTKPFEDCLAEDLEHALLRACDASRPCRDDYVCTRVPGAPKNVGACMPPYFMLQGRVDGHDVD